MIVDDGSSEPIAAPPGTRVVRRDVSRGPAAARNAGLAATDAPFVAFLDSDTLPREGWLEPLLAHFGDPRLAAIAPRVRVPAGRSALARYEAARSPLDLGPDPGLVGPGRRVGYVPAAALVVRRGALPTFDETMRFGEDVDLVWRLAAAGWTVRYEPASVVEHPHRATLAAWLRQRAAYGSSAGPLAARHPGQMRHVVVPRDALLPWALALAGRPRLALLAALPRNALLGVVRRGRRRRVTRRGGRTRRRRAQPTARPRRRLQARRRPARPIARSRRRLQARRRLGRPTARSRRRLQTRRRLGPADVAPAPPRPDSPPPGPADRALVRLALEARARTARQIADAAWRAHAPALVITKRGRRFLAAALVVGTAADYLARRPALDPLRFTAFRAADDLAYAAGVWAGCVRARTVEPLVPKYNAASNWRVTRRSYSARHLASRRCGRPAGGTSRSSGRRPRRGRRARRPKACLLAGHEQRGRLDLRHHVLERRPGLAPRVLAHGGELGHEEWAPSGRGGRRGRMSSYEEATVPSATTAPKPPPAAATWTSTSAPVDSSSPPIRAGSTSGCDFRKCERAFDAPAAGPSPRRSGCPRCARDRGRPRAARHSRGGRASTRARTEPRRSLRPPWTTRDGRGAGRRPVPAGELHATGGAERHRRGRRRSEASRPHR